MSSAACVPAPDDSAPAAHHPPTLGWALRRVRHALAPPSTRALLALFERLRLQRQYAAELRLLVRRARLFTPTVAGKVASLAGSKPDVALETFVSAFVRDHFELDEAVFGDGFELWAESATESVPLLLRGTDRVFYGDERSQLVAEIAETFGEALADRLEAIDPPPHAVLCRRLTRSPYAGVVAFSRWALGDVSNPVLFFHQHHADELVLPWTRRGVARAARLVREADDFQAPTLALARWLEHAPVEHGPLLVDAVLGRQDAKAWSPRAIRPCHACGFPPTARKWQDATGRHLLLDASIYAGAHSRPPDARPEEDPNEFDFGE